MSTVVMSTVGSGADAETFARETLRVQGYTLLAHNVRPLLASDKRWELDIIAWDGEILCFVEVRSTRSLEFGGPLATVGARKQRKIVRAAKAFLLTQPKYKDARMRFDVIGVWGEAPAYQHTLVRGAFVADT